jgi:hypothetical protein
MKNINFPEIKFSNWTKWEDKNKLKDINEIGVYLIGKFEDLPESVNLKDLNIIYIGETCNSLKARLNQFNNSGIKGKNGHSGGHSYYDKYKGETKNLYVSIFPIKELYVRYVERKILIEFISKHGSEHNLLNKK